RHVGANGSAGIPPRDNAEGRHRGRAQSTRPRALKGPRPVRAERAPSAGLRVRSLSAALDGVRRIGMIATVTLLVTAVALGGCSRKAATGAPGPTGPGPSTSATGTDEPSPDVSETPSNLFEFTVDGAGPYQLDQTLLSLRPMLDQVVGGNPPCTANTSAHGTG